MSKTDKDARALSAVSDPKKLEALSEEQIVALGKRLRAARAIAQIRHRTREHVEAVARDAGVHPSTLYRDLSRLEERGTIRDLAPQGGGFPAGRSRLHARQEELIQHFLQKEYLSLAKPPLVEITRKIGDACEAEGLARPSRAAVIRRFKTIPTRVVELKRGGPKAAEKVTPRPGRFEVEHPWDVWQADHTLADVIAVDPDNKPIGRVWVTVIIDVCTRLVVAFYVGLDAPSSIRIATAMDLAVSPKDAWLTARGLEYEWPAHGLPRLMHTDRAKEFTSRAFTRALQNQGIETILRPPGRTRYGGHVERLIGTLMGKCRMLPGATFNSPAARGNYDSKAAARLTVDDLETFFAHQILGVYHKTPHSALGMSPLEAWKRKSISRNPELPDDMEAFRLDLFPELQRTIGRQGIKAFGDEYYSRELGEAYISGLREVTLKYDPRDLSRVYVRLPSKGYIVVPYRFKHEGPAPTLWLLKASRRSRVPEEAGVGRASIRIAAAKAEQLIGQVASKSGAAARQAERLRRDRLEAGKSRKSSGPTASAGPNPCTPEAWSHLFGDEE